MDSKDGEQLTLQLYLGLAGIPEETVRELAARTAEQYRVGRRGHGTKDSRSIGPHATARPRIPNPHCLRGLDFDRVVRAQAPVLAEVCLTHLHTI